MVYYGIFELRCSIAKVNKTAAADPQKNGESPLLGNILVSQTVRRGFDRVLEKLVVDVKT